MKTSTQQNIQALRYYLDKRYTISNNLLEELKTKFPDIVGIDLYDNSVGVQTSKHSVTLRRHQSKPRVNMICDKQTMPDTVEEFLEAKKMMEADYKQALTAGFYIAMRYLNYD